MGNVACLKKNEEQEVLPFLFIHLQSLCNHGQSHSGAYPRHTGCEGTPEGMPVPFMAPCTLTFTH